MKLKFRHQKFQSDVAMAVCDVFAGQPFYAPTYMIDPGTRKTFDGVVKTISGQIDMSGKDEFTGFNNAPVAIGDDKVL